MLVSELLGVLDRLAPFSFAEPWDNCGLLVGDASGNVRRVLAALEVNGSVLEEALASEADVVLTHHPVLFSPITTLVGSDLRGHLLRNAVKADVNIIACHTNLDAAPGGLADIVGDSLGLREMRPLQMADSGWYKFVGFVPPEALSAVSEAVFADGSGRHRRVRGLRLQRYGRRLVPARSGGSARRRDRRGRRAGP